MTYELAKQLRDAGFPQTNPILMSTEPITEEQVKEWGVSFPTLSELIEICAGHGFKALNYVREEGELDNEDSVMFWMAYDLEDNEYPGHSPEEAVAKLWLALNIAG